MISEWAGLELCDIVDGWAARRASNLYGAGVVGCVLGLHLILRQSLHQWVDQHNIAWVLAVKGISGELCTAQTWLPLTFAIFIAACHGHVVRSRRWGPSRRYSCVVFSLIRSSCRAGGCLSLDWPRSQVWGSLVRQTCPPFLAWGWPHTSTIS